MRKINTVFDKAGKMKATKTKTVGRPKKASEDVESGAKKKTTARSRTTETKTTVKKTTTRKATGKKNLPSEDQIRQKAHELYLQRVARGEGGSETEDWNKAIELLADK